jgi:hypothetical protein
MDNKDMPAMPNTNPETYPTPCPINYGHGLTKHEHFAGLAMQGLCHAIDSQGTWAHDAETVAETAVRYADALLASLDKVN